MRRIIARTAPRILAPASPRKESQHGHDGRQDQEYEHLCVKALAEPNQQQDASDHRNAPEPEAACQILVTLAIIAWLVYNERRIIPLSVRTQVYDLTCPPDHDPYALAGVEPSAIESLAAPAFLALAAEDEAGALEYLRHGSQNLRRAAAAGVPIALGTDVNNPFVFPGYSAHEELAWIVRAGLTPAQALSAATAGGAAFLRVSDRIGAIAHGREADFVLLSHNPLDRIENSRRIVAVIADGRAIAPVVTAR